MGKPERTGQALARHERGARVKRPEAIEAGGGARARDGGVGAVRFDCRGGSEIGAESWEHNIVLQWAVQEDGQLRVSVWAGKRGGRAGGRNLEKSGHDQFTQRIKLRN